MPHCVLTLKLVGELTAAPLVLPPMFPHFVWFAVDAISLCTLVND